METQREEISSTSESGMPKALLLPLRFSCLGLGVSVMLAALISLSDLSSCRPMIIFLKQSSQCEAYTITSPKFQPNILKLQPILSAKNAHFAFSNHSTFRVYTLKSKIIVSLRPLSTFFSSANSSLQQNLHFTISSKNSQFWYPQPLSSVTKSQISIETSVCATTRSHKFQQTGFRRNRLVC